MLFGRIRNSNLPLWLKLLISIFLIVTCVYWVGFLTYKIIDILRLFINTLTEKKIFWIIFVLSCALIIIYINFYLINNYDQNIYEYVKEFIVGNWQKILSEIKGKL